MYNIFYININHKKVLITTVESGRVNFKMKGNTKDKERHMVKKIQQSYVHMKQK